MLGCAISKIRSFVENKTRFMPFCYNDMQSLQLQKWQKSVLALFLNLNRNILRDKSFFVVNVVTAFCPLKEKSLNTRPDIHDQQSFIIYSLLKSLSYGLTSQRILCSKVDHDIYLKRT